MNDEERDELLIRLDERMETVHDDVKEIKADKLPQRVSNLEGKMKIVITALISSGIIGGAVGVGVGVF